MPLFKNLIAYRIGPEWSPPSLESLEDALQSQAFQPCAPTQELSAGWVPPRGEEHGALVENIAGHWLLKLGIERRSVPASAVRAELEARCKAIEAREGRKPGRKEQRELKEELVHEMLPRAFTKRSAQLLWIDAGAGLVLAGAGSTRAAELALQQLVDAMAQLRCVLPVAPLTTATSPSAAMSHWLSTREAPAGFTVDRELELRHSGEERSTVRYARHTLELDEIGQHIGEGKMPTRLALTWEGKVSFVLTEAMALKRIEMIDVKQETGADKERGFDTDAHLATGELSAMLPDLLLALGGEAQLGAAPQPAPQAEALAAAG